MVEVAREAGLRPAVGDEIAIARDLAATLMKHEVVSIETILAVQAISRRRCWFTTTAIRSPACSDSCCCARPRCGR